jgi:hypothetical protein
MKIKIPASTGGTFLRHLSLTIPTRSVDLDLEDGDGDGDNDIDDDDLVVSVDPEGTQCGV